MASPNPFVIFGPPGTGKSVTVCEAIKQVWYVRIDAILSRDLHR